MNTNKLVVLFLVLFAFSSCKDEWLEVANPNLQTTETFWNTEDHFKRGVNAAYQSLAIYDGTYMRFAPIAMNLKADDAWSPSPWPVLSLVGGFNVSYGDPIMQQFLWTAFYGVVNRANQVITNIEGVEFEQEATKKQYKGEALFLRALANYHLVKFYNNIIDVTKTYESDADYTMTQTTPEIMWQRIYDDFAQAAELLPASYPEADKGRATKGAALGFLGKSYLYNGKHAEAQIQFKKVIDLGIYSLMANYDDNFTEDFENNAESVFELQFDRDAGGTTLGWVSAPKSDWSLTTAHAITFAPSPFGWGDVAATEWIFKEYQIEKTVGGEDDPRLKSTISYDWDGCLMYGKPFRAAFDTTRWGEFLVRKYTNANKADLVDEKDWRSGINTRLMRYSEILLMYAECLYEAGNAAEAAQYITMVRNRANLPDITAAIAALGKDAFYSQLSHERALEFALEGIRWDDLVRWGWLKDPVRLAELQSHDPEFDSYRADREFFPIAQGEMDRNPSLVQNPGW